MQRCILPLILLTFSCKAQPEKGSEAKGLRSHGKEAVTWTWAIGEINKDEVFCQGKCKDNKDPWELKIPKSGAYPYEYEKARRALCNEEVRVLETSKVDFETLLEFPDSGIGLARSLRCIRGEREHQACIESKFVEITVNSLFEKYSNETDPQTAKLLQEKCKNEAPKEISYKAYEITCAGKVTYLPKDITKYRDETLNIKSKIYGSLSLKFTTQKVEGRPYWYTSRAIGETTDFGVVKSDVVGDLTYRFAQGKVEDAVSSLLDRHDLKAAQGIEAETERVSCYVTERDSE